MGFNDCYVLANNRTMKFVTEFLDTFIPNRVEQTDAYELPQYGRQTEREFETVQALMQYLEANINTPYTIYWRNKEDKEPHFANCFYTNDNNLIVGLGSSVANNIAEELLTTLKNFCGSTEGCIAYEQPAPHNSEGFRRMIGDLNPE